MFKVIVERPRSGSRVRWSSGDRRFLNSEEAPTKLGMQRGITRGKWSRDHLGPLRRFLVRQAGRPWNDVFAEICAVVDQRSAVQEHVHIHVKDFVAINTGIINGEIHELGRYVPTRLADLGRALYVDPLTGVLMRNMEPVTRRQKRRALEKRSRAELDKRMRILSPQEELHRLGGLWFLVRLKPVPAMRIEVRLVAGERRHVKVLDSRWDCLLKTLVQGRTYPRWPPADVEKGYPYSYRGMYAASKRQLSSRELRLYGLR